MSLRKQKPIALQMPVATRFLPLAAAFAHHSATGFGLAEDAAQELALAAEEVVAYLTRLDLDGREVVMSCRAGSHFVETEISLPVGDIQLGAFNITARVNADDAAGLEQMGLLIASRMADRFRISRPASGNLVLSLIKERDYPEWLADTSLKLPPPLSRFSVKTPDAAQIKWFVRLVNHCYPAALFPGDFRFPGKVVDMAAAGDYHVRLAIGSAGEIGGGLAWRWEGAKTVAFCGPYLFGDENPEMARDLLEACIGDIARSAALVLITRMPTDQLPDGYLEVLGTLDACGASGESSRRSARFRLMHEDMGAVVWTHPDLVDFLLNEYRRLVFPRDIQAVASDGEAGEPVSVLSVDIDRRLHSATLRPIWPGQDAARNLADHVALLQREALAEIFFEMDLGLAWQAGFTPGLLGLGFRPRMILPYAGTADQVIFQLDSGS